MNKRSFRLLGFGFLILGVIFLLNAGSGLTGFAVVDEVGKGVSGVLGVVFVVVGLLFLTRDQWWDDYRTRLAVREYETGETTPVQAALKINDRLYEVDGVRYNEGKRFTVSGDGSSHSIDVKSSAKARDLALALYEIALINDRGNVKNCELHISKQASTKHHKRGFKRIVDRFEDRYREELEKIIDSH